MFNFELRIAIGIGIETHLFEFKIKNCFSLEPNKPNERNERNEPNESNKLFPR